ncbi:hypothetical protein [Oceanicoccus sagamiensis]|uniref:Uncharacterized protein n=1 Tax=Oceanicoccus sagamiensis TaxID=716816 RepID=A0A1X9NE86_9GAMM|nr:hypothetical protein [Oceanicoccus sagamiensis]ARN75866.1 hypothetical protein BST96_18210 [Oceanicoccus sagamiensis]
MIRWLFVTLLFTSNCFAIDKQDEPKPSMRVVDRDWSYFKSIPCEQVNKLVFHSRSEEILLAKRKRQCVEQYKAFLPVPIDR